MVDYHRFRIEKEGFITRLILNRPEKRNAMDVPFFMELTDAFLKFDEDPEVRVVLIQGEGKSFSAGLDLEALPALVQSTAADAREGLRRMILQAQVSMTALETCRKPVIAAAHGACIGGAVDLLSACDIRFAARDAVFSIRETKMAMVADLGTLQRMPSIVGEGWFRELALSGRNFTAEEALRMNFITRLCEDLPSLYREARDLAAEITECAPLAVQGVKDVIRFNRSHGLQAGLDYVAQKNAAILMSEDLLEAAQAFAQKRPPQFKGR
jgi:enoyl-CoA hydratase/carnithine racemase